MHEELRKYQNVTRWHGCGKCGVMGTNMLPHSSSLGIL